ncbi:MAG: hypothetical protein ABFE01_02220 [Phycisphaerales bacterium]
MNRIALAVLSLLVTAMVVLVGGCGGGGKITPTPLWSEVLHQIPAAARLLRGPTFTGQPTDDGHLSFNGYDGLFLYDPANEWTATDTITRLRLWLPAGETRVFLYARYQPTEYMCAGVISTAGCAMSYVNNGVQTRLAGYSPPTLATGWHTYELAVRGLTAEFRVDDQLALTGTLPREWSGTGMIGMDTQGREILLDTVSVYPY